MSHPTRIYLTGFMGSGKSTLGPPIARILQYRFVDLDQVIEETIGCTIAEFFETKGEELFRIIESDKLTELSNSLRTVIALGGGALARQNNLDLVKKTGLSVYLRWPADRLAERLSHSRQRPLLRDDSGELLSPEALEARIKSMIDKREYWYLQADLIVDLNRHRVPRALEKTVTAIRSYGYQAPSRRT